jgi:hypothetical protein
MGTQNSMRILYNTSLLTKSQVSWSLWIVDELPDCAPISSSVSDECRKSDQQFISYIETHTDDIVWS